MSGEVGRASGEVGRVSGEGGPFVGRGPVGKGRAARSVKGREEASLATNKRKQKVKHRKSRHQS